MSAADVLGGMVPSGMVFFSIRLLSLVCISLRVVLDWLVPARDVVLKRAVPLGGGGGGQGGSEGGGGGGGGGTGGHVVGVAGFLAINTIKVHQSTKCTCQSRTPP